MLEQKRARVKQKHAWEEPENYAKLFHQVQHVDLKGIFIINRLQIIVNFIKQKQPKSVNNKSDRIQNSVRVSNNKLHGSFNAVVQAFKNSSPQTLVNFIISRRHRPFRNLWIIVSIQIR